MPCPAPRSVPDDFIVEDFEPAYLELHRRGELAARAEAALRELEECCACPRNCKVNRLKDEVKVCNTGRHAVVSSAFPHFGEEDCLRGRRGSGTIFFGLCNLRCVFCQNWDISQRREGRERTAEEIAVLMLELEERGCHNIKNIMGQYRPEYEVGGLSNDGLPRYGEIARRPSARELEAAHDAARRAGLWRFDERRRDRALGC